MPTEADTCRTLVLPKLYMAGWTDDQLSEQRLYSRTATSNFAEPAFDGDPARATQEEIGRHGKTKEIEILTRKEPESGDTAENKLAPGGNRLYIANFNDYTRRRVRTLASDPENLRNAGSIPSHAPKSLRNLKNEASIFKQMPSMRTNPMRIPLRSSFTLVQHAQAHLAPTCGLCQ
jgi:hypothetical protein